jgi:hypothetical protein
MFVAEFEGLAMRLEAIGHGVSVQMRVVNFLNSLSEVSALSAVLSAHRVTDNLSWTKATTQILLVSELKGVKKMGQSARSAPWLPTMDSPAPVTHAARLIIAARTTLIVDVTRAVILCVVMEGTVEDITLIVAKEIVTLTIVKVTEVRAQEVRAKEVRATKKNSMDVAVKKVTSIVFDSQMMATTIGATPGQHLPSDITTVINLTRQTLHRTTTSSTAPLHPLWPRTILVRNPTR